MLFGYHSSKKSELLIEALLKGELAMSRGGTVSNIEAKKKMDK
jgi:hypothetical protein